MEGDGTYRFCISIVEPHSLCLQLQCGYCSYLSLFWPAVAGLKSVPELKTGFPLWFCPFFPPPLLALEISVHL